jgi:hypothetical protein
MKKIIPALIPAAVALCASVLSLDAKVTYIGSTFLAGNDTDLSGLPPTILEDGVSSQNALNGIGSGLAYAGGNVFYALGDRGPNKVVYPGGAAVDNTVSYANRFQQLTIDLTPVGSRQADGTFASYTLRVTNIGTTLLKNSQGVQYIGLSTAFSTNPAIENHRLDCEAIRVAPDGTIWISDEYGPYILHFNKQGQQIGSLPLPPGFQAPNPGATAVIEAANNTTGRTTNRGMEGLALSPDGTTLVGMMQSSLTQDGGLNGINDRVLVYDLTNPTAPPKQYVYQLDGLATPISELVAINSHQFLVDERDGVAGAAGIKKLYLFDINQATPPTDLTTTAFSGSTATNGLPATGLPAGVVALKKTLFADIGQILNAASPSPFSAVNGTNGLPDKIEGYAWGPDLPDGRHLLLATNDNDFSQKAVTGFPNYIWAFAVDPSDVPGFQPQLSVSSALSAPVYTVNFSCRANVGTGANVALAGFVINGTAGSTEQVLVRAAGPVLSQFGVTGALAQPVLTVFDAKGAVVATNTGWGNAANAAQITAAAAAVGGFTLPAGSADSAVLVTLPPGVYTAQVAGLNATTGIAILEVYEVR